MHEMLYAIIEPMKSKIIKKIILLLLAVTMLPLSSACGSVKLNADAKSGLVINEAVSANARSLTDADLGSPDWIEIYNGTGKDINLSGYGLSDNIREPHKWEFPGITLKAGDYLIVFAAKNSEKLPDGKYCTGFGISKSGESIYLVDPYYNLVDEADLPEMKTDISWARTSSGDHGYCAAPTPGAANDDTTIVDSLDNLKYTATGGDLVISEIMPNNISAVAAADGNYYSWVELYNKSDKPIDLKQYWLSDDDFNRAKWKLPDKTLGAGEYIIIYLSGFDKTEGDEYHASFKIGSDENSLSLSDSQETLVSYFSWDTGIPGNLSVVAEEGAKYTAFYTPGAANSDQTFESFAATTMDSSDPVRINEVLARNKYGIIDDNGNRSDWVELYNSSAQAVSLADYCLSDDVNNLSKWAFPSDAKIEANGYLLVYLSGDEKATGTDLHASFAISPGESIVLTCLNGMRMDSIAIDTNIGQNVSIGRDESGAIKYFPQATPGTKNTTYGFESQDLVKNVILNDVYITEVCAVEAPKSGTADWVELYNGNSYAVNLQGWYLTDDVDAPFKWQMPSFTIAAKSYGVIYCTTRSSKKKGVTAPFGISPGGETLLLYNDVKVLKDVFETGAQRNGITSGRITGDADGTRVFFTSATQGQANTASSFKTYTAQPVFSNTELYCTQPFQLTITCATEGATIYYTLDGSKPTTSSARYTGPIPISQNTPVRAMAASDGKLNSTTTTNTFLFEEKHTVPVVCLSGDPTEISQMYAVTDKNHKIEKESYVEYREANGVLGTEFPSGVRVNGAGTLVYRQKALKLLLRGGYGQSSVTYPFFKDSKVTTFKSIVLRASGQDGPFGRIKDAYLNRVVNGLNIDNAQNRVVVLYINGKYWGIYDLMENQNEDYLASHYGVDPDAVDIVRRNDTVLSGSNSDLLKVRSFALNGDLSSDANFAKLASWIDVDYFNDYLAAESFFANGDMFNQKYWRSQDNTVKWRPIFYDLDLALGSTNRDILSNYFVAAGVPSRDGSLTNMDIYVGLKKNRAWRLQFAERYIYLIYNYFDAEDLTKTFDEMVAELEPEMGRHIQRWGTPSSVTQWKANLSEIRYFLENRQEKALQQIKNYFGLSDAQMQEFTDKAKAAKAASGG